MPGAGERRCEACGADRGSGGKKLLECCGCFSAFFCSTRCQQQSWRTHKKLCRKRGRAVVKIQAGWRGWSARRRVLGRLLKGAGEGGEEACEVCGKTAPKGKELDVCDGCKLSLFCSRRCQRSGWKAHKIICNERQRAAVQIQFSWRRRRGRRPSSKYTVERMYGKKGYLGIIKDILTDQRRPVHVRIWHSFVFVVAFTLLRLVVPLLHTPTFCRNVTRYLREVDVTAHILVRISDAMTMCSMAVRSMRQRENIAVAKRRTAALARIIMTCLSWVVPIWLARYGFVEWEVRQAEAKLNGSYMMDIGQKWIITNEESGGYFYRSIEGLDSFRFFCHPYDALINLSWDVDWDVFLTDDEVEFIRSSAGTKTVTKLFAGGGSSDQALDILQSGSEELPGSPGLVEGHGYTSFAYPNGKPASEVWFTWNDASKYLFLRAELAGLSKREPWQLNYDDANLPGLVDDYRTIASAIKPPAGDFIDSGVLRSLAQMLMLNGKPSLQIEAARTIKSFPAYTWTTMAANEAEAIVDVAGPVDAIAYIQLLSSNAAEIIDASALILTHIARNSPKSRSIVLSAGVLRPLAENILQPSSDPANSSVMLLSYLCSGEPLPTLNQIRTAIPAILHVISTDGPLALNALFSLEMISEGGEQYIRALLNAGAADVIIKLLEGNVIALDSEFGPVTCALRIASHIGQVDQAQALIDAGFMSRVNRLLKHPDVQIRLDACVALYNSISGRQDNIALLIVSGSITTLIDMAKSDHHWGARSEAVYLVSHAVEFGTDREVQYIADGGAADVLCEFLDASDTAIVESAHLAIEIILEVAERANVSDDCLVQVDFLDDVLSR